MELAAVQPAHPFSLHPNESPALILVQPSLSGLLNYHSWSCAVRLALQSKNKLCFIEDVIGVEIPTT